MAIIKKCGLVVIVALAMSRCGVPDQLDQQALTEFVNDPSNGLSIEQQAGKVKMTVTHRPVDFLVYQEVGESGTQAEIAEAKARYNDYLYFLVSLSAGEKGALYGLSADQDAFSENLQVLSFRMGNYVHLTTSAQDTIPVGDYVYNRSFGLTQSDDLLFVFNKEKVPAQGWVSFNIAEFGMSTGRRNFRFDVADLKRVPRLAELVLLEAKNINQ